MSEANKAFFQSFFRAALNVFAGAWAVKHPEISGALEAFFISGLALAWTYADNKKKNPPDGPEKITVTLG